MIWIQPLWKCDLSRQQQIKRKRNLVSQSLATSFPCERIVWVTLSILKDILHPLFPSYLFCLRLWLGRSYKIHRTMNSPVHTTTLHTKDCYYEVYYTEHRYSHFPWRHTDTLNYILLSLLHILSQCRTMRSKSSAGSANARCVQLYERKNQNEEYSRFWKKPKSNVIR